MLGQELSDDEDLLSMLGSEISFEIGNELLDQAIHTENQLRETHKALINLKQLIDSLIYQGVQITEIAEYCIKSSLVLEHLEQKQSLVSFESLEDQFNQLSLQVKFNFYFGKPELILKQMDRLIAAQIHIKETKLKIDRLTQSLSQETDYSINSATIDALVSLFKGSILGIEFNEQGQVALVFDRQQQTLKDMYYHSSDLQKKLNNLTATASYLIDFGKQCVNDSSFMKLLHNTYSSVGFDELRQKTKCLIDKMETALVFEEVKLIEKVEKIKKYQLELRKVETKLELDIATKNNFSKENFNLNVSAIKVILNQFGSHILALGSDHNGEIVLHHVDGQKKVKEIIKYCIELKEEIKKPIAQGGYLITLGEQCLKHPKILQVFEEVKQSKNWSQLKEQIKEIAKSIKIDLAFHDVNKIREQFDKIKTAKSRLKKINLNLDKIIQTVDKSNSFYINSNTVEALLLLVGSISGVEFDNIGNLVINYTNRKEKVNDILQICKNLKPKVDALIQQADKLIETSEQCFKDSAFREKLKRQNKQKKLKIKFIVTASILVLLSPLAWICLVRFEQEKALAKSQTLLLNVRDANDAQDINTLKASEVQLKAAIAALRTIQDRPASNYQQAQTEIAILLSRLEAVQNRLKIENEIVVTLESAHKLATEATKISKTNDTTLNWQIASTKWQQAIDLLEAVPENTFVADRVKADLIAYRDNYATTGNERKALENLQAAQKLATEASAIAKKPPHSVEIWQQAQAKWQQAINLLANITDDTSISNQAKKSIVTYRSNYTAISKKLKIEQEAVKNIETAQKMQAEATELSQEIVPTAQTWQQAKLKCQTAISLLTAIPKDTSTFTKAQEMLPNYRSNCTEISEQIMVF